MKNTIKTELQNHLLDYINEGVLTNDNINDLYHLAFTQDHYLIGYYNCSEWLKEHDLTCFEAIEIVKQWHNDNFGSFTMDINSETVVNSLIEIYGLELVSELDIETIEDLKDKLEEK